MNMPNQRSLARGELSRAGLAMEELRQAVYSLRFGVRQFTRGSRWTSDELDVRRHAARRSPWATGEKSAEEVLLWQLCSKNPRTGVTF